MDINNTSWHKLSAILANTREDVHILIPEGIVLESEEDQGLSCNEKPCLTEIWQHPTEGIMSFKLKGCATTFDLSDYPEYVEQIYKYFIDL